MELKAQQFTKVHVPNDINDRRAGHLIRVFDKATSENVVGLDGIGVMWITEEESFIFEPDPEHDIGEAILLEQEQAIEWFIENNLLHKATDDIRASAIIC